jgi:hypothetical protein
LRDLFFDASTRLPTKLGRKFSAAIEARRRALRFVILWGECMRILLNVGDNGDEGRNKN